VGLGLKLPQVALSYGADDLHGTIIEERIFHMTMTFEAFARNFFVASMQSLLPLALSLVA